ncbi:MAG: helix-turn-helix transcriptional regulator [Rhizomicrobium sp.]|jgi:transcriptional regulator with XRE-family HTH domain
MALFFDSAWFDSRLAAAHLSRADLARALGVSETGIAEIWKDQRELSARDVAIISALLGAPAVDVATHAGTSTPVPQTPPAGVAETGPSIADLAARLDRVERVLTEVKALLLDLKRGAP